MEITPNDAKGEGLDPRENGGPGCRPAASGGVQPLAETISWCIVRHERPQEANATGGLKHLLIVQVSERSRGGGACHGNGEAGAALTGCIRLNP